MADPTTVQTMATIGINYRPAIADTERFINTINNANNAVLHLQSVAKQGLQQPMQGMNQQLHQSGVILNQHGQVLSRVGVQTQTVANQTQAATQAAAKHATTVNSMAQSYGVLGSQWERRISWFVAGAGFYGGIRAMKAAIGTFTEVETSMIVVRRTLNDLTADFGVLRDELVQAGVDFGHSWDTVQQAAIRWAQAGYDANEIVELTRTSLLALNVAQMDIEMATQGLISIMAQWGFTTADLTTVIDKLNITSDNYAVTTGDLVQALQRASGSATALGLSFEETVGLITAMRVASGRLGAEVGNALNTILAYITRQSTLNVLMKSGINVFADAANTKLRPAMHILVDIAERWGNNAEAMPEQLLEIADAMGVMSEEIAEMIGLQDEWTQMQQLEVEQSIAGVRRRNFLIALLRNFAQAQEVVVNMHGAEGYSMKQNEMTMETLGKKYEQLRMSAVQLAVAIGEAGLLGQVKSVVDGTRSAVEWFNSLDQSVQSLILTFGQMVLGIKILGTVMKMAGLGTGALLTGLATPLGAGPVVGTAIMGLTAPLLVLKNILLGIVSVMGGPVVVATIGVSAAMVALSRATQRNREEFQRKGQLLETLTKEYGNLSEVLNKTTKDSVEHGNTLEEMRRLNQSIAAEFPQLVQGYDETTRSILLNAEAMQELQNRYEGVNRARKESLDLLTAMKQQYEDALVENEAEAKRLEENAYRVSLLANRYLQLKLALEEETEASARAAEIKHDMQDIERVLIHLIGAEGMARLQAANFTTQAINTEVERLEAKAEAQRNVSIAKLSSDRSETRSHIEQAQIRLRAITEEIQALQLLMEARAAASGEAVHGRLRTPSNRMAGGRGDRYLGDELSKGIEKLQDELIQNSQFIEDAYQHLTWIDNEMSRLMTESLTKSNEQFGKKEESLKKIASAAGKVKTAFDLARESFERFSRFGVLTTQQQLDALKELERFQVISTQNEMWLREQKFSRYRDLLKEEQKLIEEAYKERLKLIDDEAQVKIDAIQAELDLMGEEDMLAKREEARLKHIQTIEDLEKKRRYHELRTGREHELAILATDRQIQEEHERWQKEQEEWARQDYKDTLRGEIDDIKKRADEEKNVWKEMYESMLEDFSDHNINILALAATYDEQWLFDGLTKAQQWSQGFRDGSIDNMQGLLGELTAMAQQAAALFPDVFSMHGGFDASTGTSTSGGSGSGGGGGGGTTYNDPSNPMKLGYDDGRWGKSKRSTAGWSPSAVSAYNTGYDSGRREYLASQSTTPIMFHEGGIAGTSKRFAETIHSFLSRPLKHDELMAILRKGEVVTEPSIGIKNLQTNLATAVGGQMQGLGSSEFYTRMDRLISLLMSKEFGNVNHFNAPLIDKAVYEDRADIDYHNRELGRLIKNAL